MTTGSGTWIGLSLYPEKEAMSAGVRCIQGFGPVVLLTKRSLPDSEAKEKKANSSPRKALCHFRQRALALYKGKSSDWSELPETRQREKEKASPP